MQHTIIQLHFVLQTFFDFVTICDLMLKQTFVGYKTTWVL